MNKTIDAERTVYALCTQYPELVAIMSVLGFTEITKPGMLHTVGRYMTLKKGAAHKKIGLDALSAALMEHGYTLKEGE